MPSTYSEAKTSLLNELWLPLAQKGGEHLFPLRKKNKGMRLFTLTDMDYQEVKAFEEKKLTKREYVVAWTHSQQQVYRLEPELGRSKILCEGRLDDAIGIDSQSISESFPCELLNLDFMSQNPVINTIGRIEKELRVEHVLVSLLNKLESKGFVLFYTTMLDQIELDSASLAFPAALHLGLDNPVGVLAQKIEFIKNISDSILENNNYIAIEWSQCVVDVKNVADKIFSFGILASRKN